ncbi:MAG: hypothetical protein LUD02_02830 [Tannerellaceae bacterium]|nr:hypothetical protein [Tannerellaceae bacterium]
MRKLIEEHREVIPSKNQLSQRLKGFTFFSEEMNISKSILIQDFTDIYLQKDKLLVKARAKVDNKKLITQKKERIPTTGNRRNRIGGLYPGKLYWYFI